MNIPLSKDTDSAPLRYHDKCDKYDYLIAAGCGVISGLVDAFLVGSPGQSVLGSWTDAQVEQVRYEFLRK